jgi:hypothetical protein
LLLAGCRGEAREKVVPIVATAEVKGTTEPCGCNSDPLGDVARVVKLAEGGLLLDAGRLLYDPEAADPRKKPQADAKAAALEKIYAQAAHENLTKVYTVNGVTVGVFTARLAEPAKEELAKIKDAQVKVAILPMPRTEARQLLKELDGVWFGIVGKEVGEGMVEAEPVGSAFLVAPADQGRRAASIELHIKDGKPALVPFGGESERKRQLDRTEKRIDTLKTQLEGWKKDPTADKSFVAAREEELKQLESERDRLKTEKLQPPAGSYFTYELVPVRRNLPRDPKTADLLKQLDKEIGAANFAAARDEAPPPPTDPAAPHYVGKEACMKCHKPAVEFWQKTVHAEAWKTLVDVNKQYNYDCIGCHVTGFGKPGGSNLGSVEKQKLVDVQCEVCHGPASKHVAESGLDDSLIKKPAERFCADNCHTPEHSDTFDLTAYLRDITGKGHGEKLRAQLGAGVTGHELRQKALSAARSH